MRQLAYNVRYSVVPINSSLLTATLHSSLCVTSPLYRFTINVRVGMSEHNSIRGKDSLFNRQHVSALLLGHHQVNTEKVLWAIRGIT
jgi:hypothetical protein